MKKLLLVTAVAMGAAHETSPMFFKKSKENNSVPVFQSEVKIADERWNQQVTQNPLLNKLDGLEKSARKEVIKSWCDKFKKHSKKPVMWTKNAQEEKEIESVHYCTFAENQGQDTVNSLMSEVVKFNNNVNCNSKSDLEFLHKIEDMQKDEWNTWQQDSAKNNEIMGIQVTYKQPVSDKQPNPAYAGLSLTQCKSTPVDCLKYFIAYCKSPYYKKHKYDGVLLVNELENSAYHNALRSLQITKATIERDLHNQSYFKQLWNYGKRQNSWQALARVNDEIALFKDQDRLVSQKDFTHREVFTRSSMPQNWFDLVKTARE